MAIIAHPYRRPPTLEWRQHGIAFKLAGLDEFREEALAFIHGVAKAVKQKEPCGIVIHREGDGEHTQQNFSVTGYWSTKGFMAGRNKKDVMIGYLPREKAWELANRYPDDLPILADVHSVSEDEEGNLSVEVILIVPSRRHEYWKGRSIPDVRIEAR